MCFHNGLTLDIQKSLASCNIGKQHVNQPSTPPFLEQLCPWSFAYLFMSLLIPTRVAGRWVLLPDYVNTVRSCSKYSLLNKHKLPWSQHEKTPKHLAIKMNRLSLTLGSLSDFHWLTETCHTPGCSASQSFVLLLVFWWVSLWKRPLGKRESPEQVLMTAISASLGSSNLRKDPLWMKVIKVSGDLCSWARTVLSSHMCP
jgi:hypothetical protein